MLTVDDVAPTWIDAATISRAEEQVLVFERGETSPDRMVNGETSP